jgi:YesN/AraC family two-component response regulator
LEEVVIYCSIPKENSSISKAYQKLLKCNDVLFFSTQGIFNMEDVALVKEGPKYQELYGQMSELIGEHTLQKSAKQEFQKFFELLNTQYSGLDKNEIIGLFCAIGALLIDREVREDDRERFLSFNTPRKFKYAENYVSLCEMFLQFIDSLFVYKEKIIERANSKFMNEVTSYVLENIGSPLTLTGVASHFEKSSATFSRDFKNILGLSFTDYLMKIRLGIAKKELKETDTKIEYICKEIGFGSVRHFFRAFKGHEALTPNEYRKLYGNYKKH